MRRCVSPDVRIEIWAREDWREARPLHAMRYQTRQFLAGVMGWPSLQPKAAAEAGLVDDGSVGAEVVGRVGVGLDLGADGLGA